MDAPEPSAGSAFLGSVTSEKLLDAPTSLRCLICKGSFVVRIEWMDRSRALTRLSDPPPPRVPASQLPEQHCSSLLRTPCRKSDTWQDWLLFLPQEPVP